MVLVILHELGHFWAAKKSGVKVNEFGVGMPPKICKLQTDKSGTEYTLNWIPLGGFVALKGEDSTEGDGDDVDAFQNAKLWKKLLIIVAGVVMNILVAFFIFTTIFTIGIKPMSILPDEIHGVKPESFLTPSMAFLQKEGLLSGELEDGPVILESVIPQSIAEQWGLNSGAMLLSLNGHPVTAFSLPSQVQKLSDSQWNILRFLQDNEEKTLTFDCGNPCSLGVVFQNHGNLEILPIKFPLHTAMIAALKEIKGEWNMTMSALWNIGSKLFSFNSSQSKEALNQLTWPVGAIKFGEKLLDHYGWLMFLGFWGMLSLALAFFNILPIPALDGGRFWMLLIQAVFNLSKEKFSKVEGWINIFFFWAFMVLGLVIIFKDLIVWRGLKLPFVG